jgi:hypothetical protein
MLRYYPLHLVNGELFCRGAPFLLCIWRAFRCIEYKCSIIFRRGSLAWLGLAWLGLAWLGLAWLGLAVIKPVGALNH